VVCLTYVDQPIASAVADGKTCSILHFDGDDGVAARHLTVALRLSALSYAGAEHGHHQQEKSRFLHFSCYLFPFCLQKYKKII
jgi:hypothetical protein